MSSSPEREEDQPASPTSPGSPARPPAAPQHSLQQQQQQQKTLKARVNSLLRKTLADNSERDRVTYTSAAADGSPGSEGSVTGRLIRHTRVVVSVREARQLVSSILAARQPVSFDGEGVNLGPSGPMTLLQIGLVTGQIYIFDVMVERNLMYEGGLRELLESSDIVKVSAGLLWLNVFMDFLGYFCRQSRCVWMRMIFFSGRYFYLQFHYGNAS